MKIEATHLFTGGDGESHFEERVIDLEETKPERWVSGVIPNSGVEFQDTPPGTSLGWHNAPRRQYVVTLGGRVEIETRTGEKHVLQPGSVLLVSDVTGGGHRWRILGHESWRRMYVRLGEAAP